jgi:hypothetical protein
MICQKEPFPEPTKREDTQRSEERVLLLGVILMAISILIIKETSRNTDVTFLKYRED